VIGVYQTGMGGTASDVVGGASGGISALIGGLQGRQEGLAAADSFRQGAYGMLDELREDRLSHEMESTHQREMAAIAANARSAAREQRERLTAAEEQAMAEMERRLRGERGQTVGLPWWGWALIGTGGIAAALGLLAVVVK